MEDEPTIPGYRLEGELGRGAMGVVYRAVRLRDGLAVAIKVARADTAHDEQVRQRFMRELTIVTTFAHPNVTLVIDGGDLPDGGGRYMVSEFLDGNSLEGRQGRLDEAAARKVIHQMTLALDYVHGRGVIHRDVKPSNIVESTDGRLVLIDFGLACGQGHERLTMTGAVVGTIGYQAPEQVRVDGVVTGAADFFGLGATVYTLLTGESPYDGPDVMAMAAGRPPDRLPRLRERRSDCSEELCRVVTGLLAGDVAARLQRGADVRAVVRGERWVPPAGRLPRPPSDRRQFWRSRAMLVAWLAAALVLAVRWWWPSELSTVTVARVLAAGVPPPPPMLDALARNLPPPYGTSPFPRMAALSYLVTHLVTQGRGGNAVHYLRPVLETGHLEALPLSAEVFLTCVCDVARRTAPNGEFVRTLEGRLQQASGEADVVEIATVVPAALAFEDGTASPATVATCRRRLERVIETGPRRFTIGRLVECHLTGFGPGASVSERDEALQFARRILDHPRYGAQVDRPLVAYLAARAVDAALHLVADVDAVYRLRRQECSLLRDYLGLAADGSELRGKLELQLVHALCALGEVAEARQVVDAFMRSAPSAEAATSRLAARARLCEASLRYDEAIDLLERLRAVAPNFAAREALTKRIDRNRLLRVMHGGARQSSAQPSRVTSR